MAETYIVGGAVRDRLLGLPVTDRDWVVVGSSPEALLAEGYLAVGKDFPVFLHPTSKEEYALARTERKSGSGYHGFSVYAAPDVTLEDDLIRRDLTINAMAEDESGELVDPYGGLADLEAKVFRHVSPAFAEDPLRVLRLARFAARFVDFTVAPETMKLCRQLVDSGEVGQVVVPRLWKEFSRGLMSAKPSRMIDVLRECGALKVLLPELDALFGIPQNPIYHPEVDTGLHLKQCLDYAAAKGDDLATRYAILCHDFGKGTTPKDILPAHHDHERRSVALLLQVNQRWQVPKDCAELAQTMAAEHGLLHTCQQLRPPTLLTLLLRCDALRRPERFQQLLNACEADKLSRPLGLTDYPPRPFLLAALQAVNAVNAGEIAKQSAPERIVANIETARLNALKQWKKEAQHATL
jgi:tRNA nucleotidyltransferase (CCA-adding enzyme)